MHVVRYLVEQGVDINIKNDLEVSEQKYTADCKLVLLVRVCFHSPCHTSIDVDLISGILLPMIRIT